MALNPNKNSLYADFFGGVDMLEEAIRIDLESPEQQIVEEISLELIDDLDPERHPFYKTISRNIDELAESVRIAGVIEPIIVIPKGDRYISLAGHRRRLAAQLAGLTTIPAIVKHNIMPDMADIIITDTNLHGRRLLPSEKGKAYKMMLEALKHQGKRSDFVQKVEAAVQNEEDDASDGSYSTSRELIADRYDTTPSEISKYVRIAEQLHPSLLEMTDDNSLSAKAAYILSFLSREQQACLAQGCTPLTIKQAEKIRDIPSDTWSKFGDANDVLEYIKKPKKKKEYSAAAALAAVSKRLKREKVAPLATRELQAELEELLYEAAMDYMARFF